jgi:hypothetical protein
MVEFMFQSKIADGIGTECNSDRDVPKAYATIR